MTKLDTKKLAAGLMTLALGHLEEANRLQMAARYLRGENPGGVGKPGKPLSTKPKRKLSQAAIERIRAAQKKRWAKVHAAKKK